MAARTDIVVAWSDAHCNSTVGLLPPTVRYDTGAEYHASPEQLWLWDTNQELCKHITKLKRKCNGRVITLFNGDGPDRNYKSGGYDLITCSRAEIVRWTVAALQPMRDVSDVWIHNRGTMVHEGGSGELTEMVAEKLDALKQPGRDTWSWWDTELIIGGVRFYFGHRPISSSYREHTRGAGAMRTGNELWASRNRMDDPRPDVAVFSHVHHYEDSGLNCPVRCVFTPPWKLCDSYGYALGFGARTEPVGAWIFTVRKGQYAAELWTRQPPRAKPLTL